MKGLPVLCVCLALGLGVDAPRAETIPINPAATYLRTVDDPHAADAKPIPLRSIGINGGDVITVRVVNSYDRGGGYGEFSDLIGVFSRTGELLPSQRQERVPGASDAGNDAVTHPTWRGKQPTDIAEDFWISDPHGRSGAKISVITIEVPVDASYLFVGPNDVYFGDNRDPDGDFALVITPVARTQENGFFSPVPAKKP